MREWEYEYLKQTQEMKLFVSEFLLSTQNVYKKSGSV